MWLDLEISTYHKLPFYEKLWDFIATKKNISFIEATVVSIQKKSEGASVKTLTNQYHAVKLINSIDFNQKHTHQEEFPVLLQHFTGWFIETKLKRK